MPTLHDKQGKTLHVCLCEEFEMLNLVPFGQGDTVTIECFCYGHINKLTGQASGPHAACFRTIDLARVGVGLHQPVYVSIQKVNGQPPRVRPSPDSTGAPLGPDVQVNQTKPEEGTRK